MPADLVDIVTSPRIIEMDTLNQQTRPLAGGVEINYIKRPYLYSCTLGFNAVHPTHGAGFVTNSHCTGRRGSVDGTPHFQPYPELVAREVADPALFTGGICPRRMQCSYADVAFSKYESGITGEVGVIKRADTVNTRSLSVGGQSLITSEATVIINDVVNKVGRTTGETQGTVDQTGVNIGVSGTSIVMLDQVIVARPSGMSGPLVAGGDSGSPVFKDTGSGNVALTGILWGGATDGSMFVYSPIARVQKSGSPGPALGTITNCAGSVC